MTSAESWVHAEQLLTPGGWLCPGSVAQFNGSITQVVAGAPPAGARTVERMAGAVVPGIPNVHSHAFQRAMVGRTEMAGADGTDNFWSWRSQMYALAQSITPEQTLAVARQLYAEMLRSGFTSVGEFHYVHHQPDGTPYENPALMSRMVLEAAEESGIRITHLPVFYAHGGVGQPTQPHQKRFAHRSTDSFLELLEHVKYSVSRHRLARVGMAPHSLRAATPEEISRLLEGFPKGPIHIHVAEQPAEVEAVLAAWGQRPVDLLLNELGANERWCLVHATHLSSEETRALAASQAVVALCPTTEGNLGDGVMPARDFLALGGRFAVGSDSHVVVDAAEEIRLLEVGQRLTRGARNVMQEQRFNGHVGRTLLEKVWSGGAQALQQNVGRLEVGAAADLLVLDTQHPRLCGLQTDRLLDAWLLAAGPGNVVRHVMVGGQWVVRDGVHFRGDRILGPFVQAMKALAS